MSKKKNGEIIEIVETVTTQIDMESLRNEKKTLRAIIDGYQARIDEINDMIAMPDTQGKP